MIPSLKEALVPRNSVFEAVSRDDVYSINDLDTLDAREFFAQNFVTSGMKTLLTDVFSRMDGTNPEASGSFLLSQSMGGGKTHSLLALGLLAKTPSLREPVMGDFYRVAPLGAVKVLTFSGREDPEYGIWGHFAEKLRRSEVFQRFYSPLRAPGESDWVHLLQGDTTLLLIDELPPYLDKALQISLGQSTLAHATVTAMANLLSAVNSGKLPNVTLVMTDLSGSSYALANDQLNAILGDLEKEAERTVQTISPVRLDTPELYDILRTRLFEEIPSEAAIADIAAAFRDSIEDAGRVLDVPTDRASELQSGFRRTYPFHPSMMDLFARFRENQGYQQTRALIRIMRQVVASMWESGLAETRSIIGAHDVDPGNPRLAAEIRKINDRFENAIAHDISNETGDAVAQQVDGPNRRDAQDIARIILISSLSTATDPLLGLTRTEIVTYLASPNRVSADLNAALDSLVGDAWYLHATSEGRVLFRTTENVRARIASTVQNVHGDTVRNEIAKGLEALYAPTLKDVYQDVKALPDLKDITITADRTTLIIARPEPPASSLLRDFYDSIQFRNRVLFITSREQEYNTVVNRKRHQIATQQLLKELAQKGVRADDPQLEEARELATQYESSFYFALREAFFTLLSPGSRGLTTTDFTPQYDANRFKGENVVREALVAKHQYVTPAEMMEDSFRQRIERTLWPAESKQAAWTQIRNEAAQDPSFPMHQPGKLDDVRQQAVQRGQWRLINDGRYVEKGPFEQEKARVAPPRIVGSPDPTTGAVTLKVDALNADKVTFIHGDGRKELVQGGQITVTDLKGRFVAEDTTGQFQAAEPMEWHNDITIRYHLHTKDNQRHITLQAVPQAPIRYTIDGSSPLNSGLPYTNPFPIPDGATKVQAIAESEGVRSETEIFAIPAVSGDDRITIDDGKPATWKQRVEVVGTAATYALLELLDGLEATVEDVGLDAEAGQSYSSWAADGPSFSIAQIRKMADLLMSMHTGWGLRVRIDRISFPTGRDLKDFADKRGLTITPANVEQRS